MGNITEVNPDLLIALNALLSILFSDDLGPDALNVWGNFIVTFGSLLLTKAAQLSVQQSKADAMQQLKCLEQQVDKLKRDLNMK